MTEKPREVVIPKEEAVFWLDKDGWWRNEGGRFRKKKIIDYFHQAIGRDEGGYFLWQDKGGVYEKVYFPYEDTALFVFDIKPDGDGSGPIRLLLNTGAEVPLNPDHCFICEDNLYMMHGDERVKFAERALMKISEWIKEDADDRLVMCLGGRECVLPEKERSQKSEDRS